MKKLFLIFFAQSLYMSMIFSCELPPYDAIINLGGDCQVAYQMQINGLRKCALPFDKLIAPFSSLQKLLEERFEGYMDPDNFELVDDGKEKYILDKKYATRLIHDFKLEEDFLKDLESIKQTYIRRIDRLFALLRESENPLIIRKIINKEQAIALKKILDIIRPGKPFTIVALDGTEEIKTNWDLEEKFNLKAK